MMRRGFWLVLGVAIGVSGYRRVSRVARGLRPAGAAGFLRDVRDGMDEYAERQTGHRRLTLEGQQVPRWLPAAAGRPRERPPIDYAKDGR